MIWLLPPPPLSSVSKRKRDNLRREGGGGQIVKPQESLVLYKSLNTLWSNPRLTTDSINYA
jgi:hypothetical protein